MKIDGNKKFPHDIAAGVGILLSDRAHSKCITHGPPCERITWVRLKGPVTNLFIIGYYIPHRSRIQSDQQTTLTTLLRLLVQIPPGDCIVLLTDLNEQLPANDENVTGKWTHDKASPNAEMMMDMIRQFDLFSINTAFQPKRNSSNATFIKTTAIEGHENENDMG